MDINNKIRNFRLSKNLSKAEFGKLINKSVSSIEKYESGETGITVDLLEDIANALDINIVNFFVDEDDLDDILVLIKQRFNLKDNKNGTLEYDFKLLMDVLKARYS